MLGLGQALVQGSEPRAAAASHPTSQRQQQGPIVGCTRYFHGSAPEGTSDPLSCRVGSVAASDPSMVSVCFYFNLYRTRYCIY